MADGIYFVDQMKEADVKGRARQPFSVFKDAADARASEKNIGGLCGKKTNQSTAKSADVF